MTNRRSQFPLSPNIVDKLNEVRSTLRRYVVGKTTMLAALWLLLVFWLGGALDYLPVRIGSSESPRWLRIALLIAMAAGVAWLIIRWMLPRLLRPLQDRSLALLIERRHPQLDNELVTAVELSEGPPADVSNAEAHQRMLTRVHDSVGRSIKDVAAADLFNWRPLWMLSIATGAGVLITLVAAIGMSDWMGLWCSRLFGLSEQRWPRMAALRADGVQLAAPSFTGQLSSSKVMVEFEDGVARVPAGSEVLLQISADKSARRMPEVCTLFYTTADGGRGRANLRRVGAAKDGWQPFVLDGPPLDGLSEDLTVDVVGLDARLRDLKIVVVEPIAILDMQVELTYPEYLASRRVNRSRQETLPYRSGMSIPEGTTAVLKGRASGELSKAEFMSVSRNTNLQESAAEGSTVDAASMADEMAERSPQVALARVDGDQFAIDLGLVSDSLLVEIRLADQYGLPAEQVPKYVLAMQPDTIPDVASQLLGIGSAVTPVAVLPIRGTVTDDNELAKIQAELRLDDEERATVELSVNEDGELESDVDLRLLAETGRLAPMPGDALGLLVTATDYYDLDMSPHTGAGQPQQLSIVTEDQLLVLLDRQELELRQRLELIMLELTEMRSLLQSLTSSLLSLDAAAAEDGAGSDDGSAETRTVDDSLQQRRRGGLWAQQCVLQTDKSQQELLSFGARVDNLRQQLVNNRVDSYDRQQRLQENVYNPLQDLLLSDYASLQKEMLALMQAVGREQGLAESQQALTRLDAVLLRLEAIKASMLDMESFNEIVDLVRGLLDDQESLLDETEREQKKRILDFLQ